MKESDLKNRFTYSNFVQYLLLSQQYERAEELLTTYDLHPHDRILHLIHLDFLIRNPDRAVERLVPLLKDQPENPYFRLGALEVIHHTQPLSKEDLVIRYNRITELATVSDCPCDVLAKVALSASVKGLWSFGLPHLIQSMKLIATSAQQQVVLLSPTNEKPITNFLQDQLSTMNDVAVDDSPKSAHTLHHIPDPILSRILAILITASEMEIPEATFLIAQIASRHPELSQYGQSPRGMIPFAIRHSPGWIGLQLPYSKEPIIHWN